MSNDDLIECKSFKSFKDGTLQGFAKLYVKKWGINIYNCAYHIKGKQEWIYLPSKEYTNENNEKKHLPHISFENKSHLPIFISEATKAIKHFLSNEVNEIP